MKKFKNKIAKPITSVPAPKGVPQGITVPVPQFYLISLGLLQAVSQIINQGTHTKFALSDIDQVRSELSQLKSVNVVDDTKPKTPAAEPAVEDSAATQKKPKAA